MLHLTHIMILGLILSVTPALAWEQHMLPTAHVDSSTPHYGGNKAPLVLSPRHIRVAVPDAQGIKLWDSNNDGIRWTSSTITGNPQFTQVYLLSAHTVLSWGAHTDPTLFTRIDTMAPWSPLPHTWPLPRHHVMHINRGNDANVRVLATAPQTGKLVEGALYLVQGSSSGWQQPVLISSPQALVGDAAWLQHASGLQSIVWSERNGNSWHIRVRNSSDGVTWSAPYTVVQHIAAPYFQESAVHIAVDTLNTQEIALAFTGWSMQPYSQLWSKAFDAVSGVTTQALSLLPDAGDMVLQPSLVSLGNNTWAVAWQQKIGLDSEIYMAQHHADGQWSHAVNVSMDPMHMDRDPHIAQGSSQTLNIAFTRRIQADIQEVYMLAEGDVRDASLDSDGDGMPDSQEQGFDLDHDGIDDAQSARIATWLGQDGRYALMVMDNGELRGVQVPDVASVHVQEPATHTLQSHLFAFRIHALQAGETTRIHVLTPHNIAADSTWLKLNPNAQWSDSEAGTVMLNEHATGLIISLTDGGAGDEDGIQDGVIVDPAALATPRQLLEPSTTNTDAPIAASTSAGCLTAHQAGWHIMLMLGISLMLALRPRKHR